MKRFPTSNLISVALLVAVFAFSATDAPAQNNPGTNVSSYNPTLTDPLRRFGGFGEITSTANLAGRDGFDERQIRVGLKLRF